MHAALDVRPVSGSPSSAAWFLPSSALRPIRDRTGYGSPMKVGTALAGMGSRTHPQGVGPLPPAVVLLASGTATPGRV